MRNRKVRRPASPHREAGWGWARALGWFSLMGALLLLGSSLWGERGWLELRRARQEKAHMQEQIQGLERENQVLRREIAALREDPYLVEKIAREELGLVKPGEIVYEFK
ncbi:MAG: septum formation initiator family protein [Candidatus Tectomicrobia bacterium]|uniref:Septum formation initiator family protein n=1 Tax=Tectimicrobiota bacterium TaxID=2528274 RepID=A0A932CN62_UNCTE|nr:septum formation initiator family protein [Candidatus Tectomicrobia bacterium]